MLVQSAEVRVPGTDAWCRQAAMRGPGFALSLIHSSGIATDWGAMAPLVDYIGRQTRAQLSIVLAGHGYVIGTAGARCLRAGDVVELDQKRHDDEGYAGSPCEVLVVEWDDGGTFGAHRRAPPRVSRIARADVERLRALTARLGSTHAERWVAELAAQLVRSGSPRRAPRRGSSSMRPSRLRRSIVRSAIRGRCCRPIRR